MIRSQDVRARKAARQVSYRWDDDGSLIGSFRLSPEDGARFVQGLQVARDRLPDVDPDVEEAENSAVRACAVCQHEPAVTVARCPHLPGEAPWHGDHVPAGTSVGARPPAKTTADAHTPDGRALHATAEPAATPGPLPHDPAVRADAVTGEHTGGPINLHDTIHALCNMPSRT